MAVLEKIRVKFGVLITILVALALLSFILDPSTLRNFVQMASNDNKVGEMAGKNVSYKDFYEEFDSVSKLAEMSGQSVNDERAQSALRDAAWQEIFDENVFLPKVEKAGVFVTDQEMYDLTQGSAISPVLAQQGMFSDENGNFNRAALAQFVQSIDADETGNSAKFWNYLESSVYKSQLYAKYLSLIEASSVQNAVEKARAIAENNVTSDVNFIMVPAGFEPDSTIKVSKEEIKAYYDARKSNMIQKANRDIQYVMFEVVPSQEDIEETKAKFDELYEEFKTAENNKNFIALNSDGKFDTYYYTASKIESNPEFSAIFGSPVGTVSAVHEDEDSFSAAKVNDRKMMSESVSLKYAVFPLTDDDKAEELLATIKKSGPTADMQELGTFTQDVALASGLADFYPVFSTSEKAMKIKVTSAQAIFVLYITDKAQPQQMVQFATLVKNIMPSEGTYRDYLMKATEIADKAEGKGRKFIEAAQEANIALTPVKNLTEDTRRVGTCDNARELVRWVFDKKTKNGSVSDVIVVDNKYYFVACVDRIRKDGQIDIRDVAKDIRTVLAGEKKIAAKKDEVASKIQGCTTLEEMAEALGTTVSSNPGLSFGSQYQQLEGSLIGAVANAEQGKIVGPVAGEAGVYVFQVAERANGTFFTEDDARMMGSQKGAYHANILQNVLMREANVKDNRARFF